MIIVTKLQPYTSSHYTVCLKLDGNSWHSLNTYMSFFPHLRQNLPSSMYFCEKCYEQKLWSKFKHKLSGTLFLLMLRFSNSERVFLNPEAVTEYMWHSVNVVHTFPNVGRFYVLIVVLVKSWVFWVIIPCQLVNSLIFLLDMWLVIYTATYLRRLG
jgi:hypothetical protein